MEKDISENKETPPKKFPFKSLPKILGDFGRELSSSLQVADSIVGTSLLSIASLLTQNKANISVGCRKLPINLFTLVVADSGERKTTVDRVLLETIREKEQKDFNDLPLKSPGETPIHPKILMQEPTIEGIFTQFEWGRNALGLFSDEGAKMIGGYSMSKQMTTAGHLSNLWDGNPIERTRFKEKLIRQSVNTCPTLYNKRLSVCLMVQNPVFHRVWKSLFLQEQGLLARFLICVPAPLVGTRVYSLECENAVFDLSKQSFEERVSELLEELDCGNDLLDNHMMVPVIKPMREIKLDDKSLEHYLAFNNEIEEDLGIGGVYRPIKAFASKITEQSLRIGGVFSLFEDSKAEIITEKNYEKAVTLSKWYLQEVLKIANSEDVDDINLYHKEVLNILMSRQRRGLEGLTLKEITHRCITKQIRNKGALLPILENLQRTNLVSFDGVRWSVFDKAVTTK